MQRYLECRHTFPMLQSSGWIDPTFPSRNFPAYGVRLLRQDRDKAEYNTPCMVRVACGNGSSFGLIVSAYGVLGRGLTGLGVGR